MTQYAAYLGIDWADKKHDLCLVDAATGRKTTQVLPHTPQAIAEYFTNLRTRYPGQLIAVGLEQSRGPLLFALLQYDFLVLYPLNPTTLAKYREAFTPSRAKDDPSDADYASELIMKHSERLKAWHPDDPETRTLRYLVEHRCRHLLSILLHDVTPVDDGVVPHVLLSYDILPPVPTKNSIRLKIIELSSLVTEGSVLLANRTDRVPGSCYYQRLGPTIKSLIFSNFSY